jgi:hypothetical protein
MDTGLLGLPQNYGLTPYISSDINKACLRMKSRLNGLVAATKI